MSINFLLLSFTLAIISTGITTVDAVIVGKIRYTNKPNLPVEWPANISPNQVNVLCNSTNSKNITDVLGANTGTWELIWIIPSSSIRQRSAESKLVIFDPVAFSDPFSAQQGNGSYYQPVRFSRKVRFDLGSDSKTSLYGIPSQPKGNKFTPYLTSQSQLTVSGDPTTLNTFKNSRQDEEILECYAQAAEEEVMVDVKSPMFRDVVGSNLIIEIPLLATVEVNGYDYRGVACLSEKQIKLYLFPDDKVDLIKSIKVLETLTWFLEEQNVFATKTFTATFENLSVIPTTDDTTEDEVVLKLSFEQVNEI